MKKFLVAVFVIILLPALILLVFAMKSDKFQTGITRGAEENLTASSEDHEQEYIVGDPEPLLRSPLQKIRVKTGQDENGAVYYTVSDSSGLLLLDRSYIGITTDVCDFFPGSFLCPTETC